MSFGSVTGTCEPLKPNSWFLVLLPALGQAEGHFLPLTLPGRSLSASALLYKQADHLILISKTLKNTTPDSLSHVT